ncbi:hypothetical protein [Candidatus Villigracilis affinis]|uniref:hypothetical protein n=1 Tax=Candidatus Villigracilis affinis TaxID=3140682 RepID=UPI0031E89E0F
MYAARGEREGETLVQEIHRRHVLPYHLQYHRCEDSVDTGDFRLMDRKVVNVLKQMKERHRFRAACRRGWALSRSGSHTNVRLVAGDEISFQENAAPALNAITGFFYFPLQVATYFGFISAGMSILAIPVVAILAPCGSHFLKAKLPHWSLCFFSAVCN